MVACSQTPIQLGAYNRLSINIWNSQLWLLQWKGRYQLRLRRKVVKLFYSWCDWVTLCSSLQSVVLGRPCQLIRLAISLSALSWERKIAWNITSDGKDTSSDFSVLWQWPDRLWVSSVLSFSIEKYLRLKLNILHLLGVPSIPLGDPAPVGHKVFRQSAAPG